MPSKMLNPHSGGNERLAESVLISSASEKPVRACYQLLHDREVVVAREIEVLFL